MVLEEKQDYQRQMGWAEWILKYTIIYLDFRHQEIDDGMTKLYISLKKIHCPPYVSFCCVGRYTNIESDTHDDICKHSKNCIHFSNVEI